MCRVFRIHRQSLYLQEIKNNSIKPHGNLSDTAYMGLSFTYGYNGIATQLIVDAEIESADKKYRKKISALWDTGVNKTVVSSRIVERLHLDPIDNGYLYTAPGEEVCSKTYMANLYLPNKIAIFGIEVVDSDMTHHDALIGMDIRSLLKSTREIIVANPRDKIKPQPEPAAPTPVFFRNYPEALDKAYGVLVGDAPA